MTAAKRGEDNFRLALVDGAQISAGLEQMSGEAMAQGVGMDGPVETRALRGSLAGVV